MSVRGPAEEPEVVDGRSPWRTAVWVGLVGLVLTVALAARVWNREQREAQARVASGGEILAASARSAVDGVTERLVALGGLYQASNEVERSEFHLFVSNFDEIDGVGGIGYMPIVADEDLDRFVAKVRRSIPIYTPFEMDETGRRAPVDRNRPEHVLVQWFDPPDAYAGLQGYDSASDETRRAAIDEARATKQIVATPFLQLLSTQDTDGFLMYSPVTDPDTGEVVGFAMASMDVSDLLGSQVPSGMSDNVNWQVTDITNSPAASSVPGGAWFRDLAVGGRRWRLTVTPRPGTLFVTNLLRPLFVLVVGLALTVLIAVGLYRGRQRVRNRREIDRLKELARAKDQFLASVSHELRTPLTSVLGFAELLRDHDGQLDPAERMAMIISVADEATDLAAIIEDLLVAARSELDLLAVTKVPVSVRAQVAQVVESLGDDIHRRVHVADEDGGSYRAVADPARVRQIVRGLIHNARRYGGNEIEVRFSSTGDGMVHLEVSDNGDGLAPEEWERIFEPYYRAHSAETQPAALGIGLAVARQLARLMDGDLTYRFESGWSIFRLSLPEVGAVEDQAGSGDLVAKA
ncbi:MAG: CHASE domain-containing protein [Acidimicrobiia bacterium]